MSALDLLPHEIEALRFLANSPDCIGVVDDESKLAAALCFISLKDRGLVDYEPSDNGPVWMITSAGEAALKGRTLQ